MQKKPSFSLSLLPSLIVRQLLDSVRCFRKTRTLTMVGMLLALEMVLRSYGTINVSDSLKISLSHLCMVPSAALFGPVVAMLQGGLCDILAFIIKPTGPYFPGFTLTAMLPGLIYGFFFYQTKHRTWQVIVARLIVIVFVNILLNTVFLVMLYGPSRLATLPVRAFKNIIQLPFDCILAIAVLRVVDRLPVSITKG